MSKKDDDITEVAEDENVETDIDVDTYLLENVEGLADLMKLFKEKGFEVSTHVFDVNDVEGLNNFMNGIVDADDDVIPEDANPLNIFYNTPGSKNN